MTVENGEGQGVVVSREVSVFHNEAFEGRSEKVGVIITLRSGQPFQDAGTIWRLLRVASALTEVYVQEQVRKITSEAGEDRVEKALAVLQDALGHVPGIDDLKVEATTPTQTTESTADKKTAEKQAVEKAPTQVSTPSPKRPMPSSPALAPRKSERNARTTNVRCVVCQRRLTPAEYEYCRMHYGDFYCYDHQPDRMGERARLREERRR